MTKEKIDPYETFSSQIRIPTSARSARVPTDLLIWQHPCLNDRQNRWIAVAPDIVDRDTLDDP
jgi:hypothetical protein